GSGSVDLGRVRAHAARAVARVERVDRRDLVRRELEAEDVEVLRHALLARRLREDDEAALQVPAQDHLGGGHTVRGCGVGHGLLLEERVLALAERAPRLDPRAVRLRSEERRVGKGWRSRWWGAPREQ